MSAELIRLTLLDCLFTENLVIYRYIVGSGSLAGVKVVGLGFRSEEEGLAIPRVVDDEELDELNEGVSGLGIQ